MEVFQLRESGPLAYDIQEMLGWGDGLIDSQIPRYTPKNTVYKHSHSLIQLLAEF